MKYPDEYIGHKNENAEGIYFKGTDDYNGDGLVDVDMWTGRKQVIFLSVSV